LVRAFFSVFCIGFSCISALEGNVSRVKGLLQKGVLADALDSAGYTALHYAARAGEVRVCEILLEHGADVNARTRNIRATALHRAASPPASSLHKSHAEVVDLLLRHGAEPNLTDVDGRTALHRAIRISVGGFDEGVKIIKKLLPITDRAIRDNHGRTVDDEFEHWKTTESDIEKIKTVRRLLRA